VSKLKVTDYGQQQFDDAEVLFFNRSEAPSSILTSPEWDPRAGISSPSITEEKE